MSMVLIVSAALLSLAAASLAIWRRSDSRADDRAWIALLPDFRGAPALFDRALVADLPEAARRYFEFTIEASRAWK